MINPTTEAQKTYNVAQIAARNSIERANGILKRRFLALKYGQRLRLKHTLPVIVATVVLHNIVLVMGDDVPPEDEELSEFMQKLRHDGQNIDFDPVEAGPPPQLHQNRSSAAVRQAVIDSHFA